MKRKHILLPLLSLALLCSCQGESSLPLTSSSTSETGESSIADSSFVSSSPESSSSPVSSSTPIVSHTARIHLESTTLIVVVEGDKTIRDSLTFSQLTAIEEAMNPQDKVFVGFYTSLEAALDEDTSALVSLDDTLSSDVDLYPGYRYDAFPADVEKHIEDYLGSYQKAGISPIPYLESPTPATFDEERNAIVYENIDTDRLSSYKEVLEEEGFQSLGDNQYLDPKEAYILTLSYDAEEAVLSLTYAFNDAENEFPANFVSSQFFYYDSRLGLYDGNFSLADNILEEGEKKFITSYEPSSESIPYSIKDVYYEPKSDDEDPVASFYEYLDDTGVCNVTTSTSSTGAVTYQAMDPAYGTQVLAMLVQWPTRSEQALGVQRGMVHLMFADFSTTSLDEENFANAYRQVTGVEYDPSIYGTFEGPKVYGSLLSAVLWSDTPALAYYAGGFDEYDLEDYLHELEGLGYTGSKSELTSYTQFSLTSADGSYGIVLRYYPQGGEDSVLFCNDIVVYLYHTSSAYEELSEWFVENNRGGGEITSLPEFEEGVQVSTDYLTSSGTDVGYTHYLYAQGVTSQAIENYKEELLATGLWKESTETEESVDAIYDSLDGYYTLYFLANGSTLTIQIYYNPEKKATGVEEILSAIRPRLGADENFLIPGLEEVVGDKAVTTIQYYNIRDQRARIEIPFDSVEEVAKNHETLVERIQSAANWKYVGTDTSGTIDFYQESESGIYLYILENNAGEGILSICLYSEI